ncbi:uncharacterized protein JCM6883_002128 [Sporobolomyces salmoneus]|uniref:uncharacterized protein n=1 Tax=Sporobolomyces salmoneus TaxID=183962 RepID=UPI00316D4553
MAQTLVKPTPASARSASWTPPTWILGWFLISTLAVCWDIGFVLARPRSFKGGDLHWIWSPYALYEKVDLVYSPSHFERGEGFTSAQTYMNIVESILNFAFLWLSGRKSPVAILVGFSAVLMTASKTVLYWLVDHQSGWAATGHNSSRDWWLLFAIPNGFWLVFPTFIAVLFGFEISKSLRIAAKQKQL